MRLFRQKSDSGRKSRAAFSVADTIQKNPALAGGSVALLVAMMLITTNAVWYQTSKHPAPIFSTRTQTTAVTGNKVRTTSIQKPHSNAEQTLEISADRSGLIKEIQTVLAEKRLYSGDVDGIYGSRTRNAIITYQQKEGLAQTGKVTAKLLTHILMSAKAPERVPVPTSQISLNEHKKPHSESSENSLVSAIQAGLKNYGYDNIVIDGVMGSQTAEAIKRFELDYGLQITGEASKKLLKKLRDIGAVDRG